MYLIEDVVEIDDIDDIDEIDGIDGKRPKSDGQETFETIFSTILYLFFALEILFFVVSSFLINFVTVFI